MLSELIGHSVAAERLRDQIARVGQFGTKVLITGESGVGKELVARSIHGAGERAAMPLVAVNCAGMPDELLESELFGHCRGSFTDAYRDKPGLLELAHGGTAFLDEIGEMTPRMQALLLRFLENGEIQRIGADARRTTVDVRIVTATNRDLVAAIAAGTFRDDLFYRLNVIHIVVPPLRERREDIPLLFDHFVRAFSTRYGLPMPAMTPALRSWIHRHAWPGNVRELKNAAERLVIDGSMSPEDAIAAPERAPRALSGGNRRVEEVLEQIRRDGRSFWSAAYDPFLAHDLTRDDLRRIVRTGLVQTGGRYEELVALFNMRESDYKPFLRALRKHDCHVAYQPPRPSAAREAAAGRSTPAPAWAMADRT